MSWGMPARSEFNPPEKHNLPSSFLTLPKKERGKKIWISEIPRCLILGHGSLGLGGSRWTSGESSGVWGPRTESPPCVGSLAAPHLTTCSWSLRNEAFSYQPSVTAALVLFLVMDSWVDSKSFLLNQHVFLSLCIRLRAISCTRVTGMRVTMCPGTGELACKVPAVTSCQRRVPGGTEVASSALLHRFYFLINYKYSVVLLKQQVLISSKN